MLLAHSRAKLAVIRQYLRAYLAILIGVPGRREKFKLDLVDGFSGGGEFTYEGEIVAGTPVIMLEEVARAKRAAAEKRRKPLEFDIRYHFNDKAKLHAEHLRKVLKERGLDGNPENITIETGAFAERVDAVIERISQHQPRAGRAIILLDQCGWSEAPVGMVRKIFRQLPNAEVILTMSAEMVLNLMRAHEDYVRAVAGLELSKKRVDAILKGQSEEERSLGYGAGQRVLRKMFRAHIREVTGAPYDTPFYIRPTGSRRALWFFHLSRHPLARDVMVQQHWKEQNEFEHYGELGFGMMGWESLRETGTPMMRHFGEAQMEGLRRQLENGLPQRLYSLMGGPEGDAGEVSIDAMRRAIANETAAPFSLVDEVVLELRRSKEFEIIDAAGKEVKGRNTLKMMDRICRSRNLLLPL